MPTDPKATKTPVVEDDYHRSKRVSEGYKKEHTGVHIQADLLAEAGALDDAKKKDDEKRQEMNRKMQSGKSILDAALEAGVSTADLRRLFPTEGGSSENAELPRDEATQPEIRVPDLGQTEPSVTLASPVDQDLDEKFLRESAALVATVPDLETPEERRSFMPFPWLPVAGFVAVLCLLGVGGYFALREKREVVVSKPPVEIKTTAQVVQTHATQTPAKEPEVAEEVPPKGEALKPVKKPVEAAPTKKVAEPVKAKEPDPKPKVEPAVKVAEKPKVEEAKTKQESVKGDNMQVTVTLSQDEIRKIQAGEPVTVGTAKEPAKQESPVRQEPPKAATPDPAPVPQKTKAQYWAICDKMYAARISECSDRGKGWYLCCKTPTAGEVDPAFECASAPCP